MRLRSISIRELVHGDEAIATTFLASRPNTTMFLRSNLARAGLGYAGAMYQGVYAGAFDDTDNNNDNTLVGIVAHYWNDNVILAAGVHHAAALTRAVVALSKRPIKGLLGPYEEVVEARRASGAAASTIAQSESKEILFTLDLVNLVVPQALSENAVAARRPHESELPMLLEWRMAYAAETMHVPDTPEKREQQKKFVDVLYKDGKSVVLVAKTDANASEQVVAYSAFNASLPDTVQVGGVWTPPQLRGRGYARCAVAASLLEARDSGVVRAILFTGEDNIAAQRCYASLGFRAIGDYALVFF